MPLATATGTAGILELDLGKCLSICKPVIEVRVVGFDTDGHAGYSEPHYFEIRDPEHLYAELLNPHGRTAVVRISEVATDGAILGVDVIDGGSGYLDSTVSFSLYSENGKGEPTALLDEMVA